ncbi:sugar ABC transporter substrate-binding protein [Actinoplanes subtropicus]|uniref:sugar ABC transporter substrate-binding protein n=1 Tax=Actinoplanes subtropicus TaxID=543632 RepID=UPI0004C30E74|nr:sugar ABC transporter substrate-binding protein [Actinoplanes subtropicus]
MNKRLRHAALAAVLVLPLAACTSTSDSSTPAASAAPAAGGSGYPYKFAVVTHGSAGDAFWSVVKAGAVKGGQDEGVTVDYQSDGDPTKQAQLIDAAVNQKVDGLVVSMANPDALKASIQKAVAAGIPVITINAGLAQSKEFGALVHVGQDETVAGQAAGERLKDAGVKHLLCVIQEAGNVALETRCSSAKAGLGGTTDNLQVDNNNPTAAQATIKAKLQADKSIDGVLTLGGQMAVIASQAIADAGSSAKLATFDLNSDVTSLLTSGKALFAVDQQPFAQGYMPIVLLTLYKSNLNLIGGGQPVLTGPSFVTPDNAAQVAKLAESGTR